MIDNELKYADVITIHDGYELNRQDKICPSVCIFQIVLTAEEIMNPDINEVNLSRIICSLENIWKWEEIILHI